MWTLGFATFARAVFLLIDTDVVIGLLRGRVPAREAVSKHHPIEISAVTYMEVAQGVRNRQELQLFRRTVRMNGWRILPLTEEIGSRAIAYVEEYALSHGTRMGDALVAASAVVSGLGLLTGNTRHYRFLPGLVLERYDPAGQGV